MPPSAGDAWEAFWQRAEDLSAALGRSTARNVNSAGTREQARALVQNYFRDLRPHLMEIGAGDTVLADLDEPLQELLRLANGRNRRTSYRAVVRRLRVARTPMEIERERRMSIPSTEAPGGRPTDIESRILATLTDLVPTAALSYQQAIRDLADGDRVSYRGVGAELREALREALDHLAPDVDVMKDPGFKLEKGATKPTMKQKARFILRSRGVGRTAASSPQDAIDRIESGTAALARSVYNRGSLGVRPSNRWA